jgi:sodium-coupled neutral amino acid transporter 9
MMGTSLLSMPWAIERAGVIPGVTLLLFMALLSFYTAYRILEVFEAHGKPICLLYFIRRKLEFIKSVFNFLENSVVTDFAVLCKRLLGKWAQWVAVIFSVFTLLGACIVYWVLMSNFLYHTVNFLHTELVVGPTPNETIYSDSSMSNCQFDDAECTVLFVYSREESVSILFFLSCNFPVYCPSSENGTEEEDSGGDNDQFHAIWSLHRTVPLFLIVILGPLACIRSPTFFTKFNSLGE